MAGKRYHWSVFECGSEVASAGGSAADSETAEREMMHYVMMYGQDGSVRFRMECGGEVLVSGISRTHVREELRR